MNKYLYAVSLSYNAVYNRKRSLCPAWWSVGHWPRSPRFPHCVLVQYNEGWSEMSLPANANQLPLHWLFGLLSSLSVLRPQPSRAPKDLSHYDSTCQRIVSSWLLLRNRVCTRCARRREARSQGCEHGRCVRQDLRVLREDCTCSCLAAILMD